MNQIINSDCIEGMKKLADNTIDCCVTSPPYFGLRDYGHDGQIGLEETPDLYVQKMVDVFTEVKRVLKKEGTLWLNLGDSYASNTKGKGRNDTVKMYGADSQHLAINNNRKVKHGVKEKDLIGIPWLVAFALRSSGWYLRQDIIWHKPNPMPESVTDRCTKSHEYIFLLSKSAKYYYDADLIKQTAISEPHSPGWVTSMNDRNDRQSDNESNNREWGKDGKANKRSVWTVTTKPFSEAHFATFPEDLIVDCIKAAGCPEFVCNKCGKARIKEFETEFKGDSNKRGTWHQPGKGQSGLPNDAGITKKEFLGLSECGCNAGFSSGICLDPFMGAGTTALVSAKLNRQYVGFEINPEYIKIAEKRLRNELGMFAPNKHP